MALILKAWARISDSTCFFFDSIYLLSFFFDFEVNLWKLRRSSTPSMLLCLFFWELIFLFSSLKSKRIFFGLICVFRLPWPRRPFTPEPQEYKWPSSERAKLNELDVLMSLMDSRSLRRLSSSCQSSSHLEKLIFVGLFFSSFNWG